MKGFLGKIHKLEFMTSSDNSILFPRLGRRLFQVMRPTSYKDGDFVKGLEYVVNKAVSNYNEELCEETLLLPNNEDIMESKCILQ